MSNSNHVIQSGETARPRRRRAVSALDRQNSWAARLHRWTGLTIGLIFALTGLTGSYLAFYPEIEAAAIAPLRNAADARPESYEAVYQAFIEVGPPERGRWNIELPMDQGAITGRFNERGSPMRMVTVDPLTLEVIRDVRWGETMSTWVYALHNRLLLEQSGKVVMGTVSLAFIAMIAAGMVLWWRSGRTVESRLKFDSKGTGERKLYDFHRLLGLGSAVLLMVCVGTATAMSFPGQFRPMLAAFSPRVPLPDPQSGEANGRPRVSVDHAMAIAGGHLPNAVVRWVQVPNVGTAAYVVRVWQPGEPSFRFPKSYVWIDQYDGRVLATRHGPQDTAADKILNWLYPLHSGQAFGMFGRLAVAVLGLVPAALFISGLVRWRRKSARLSVARRRVS